MSSPTRLLIIGAGGHGRSVAESASLSGNFEIVGFADDHTDLTEQIMGKPVIGVVDPKLIDPSICDQVIIAIGSNSVREGLMVRFAELGFSFANVVHPQAFVSPTAKMGDGIAIMAGAIIGTEASLGRGAIINCGAVVDHHAQVKDYGHLGVAACMAGGATIGRGAWVQAGSAIGYGASVPDYAILKPNEGFLSSLVPVELSR